MSVPKEKTLWQTFYDNVRFFGLQKESSFVMQNLSVLVNAGIGILEALSSVRDESRSWRLKRALSVIIEDVESGTTLARALSRTPMVTPYTHALIELGEASGRLGENLKVAALQNEKEAQFRAHIRSALLYSVFVFTVALVIGVGIAWFVLPQVAGFFEEIDAPLPFLTRAIIATGVFLQVYGYFFVPLFLLTVFSLFYFLFSFPKTKFIGHRLLFHLPLLGRLIKETEVSRFGFITGTMLHAGVSLRDIFAILPSTTTFGNYRKLYIYMQQSLVEGHTFRHAFSTYKKTNALLPSPVRQMVAAAERSGTLGDTFLKVGELYEMKVDTTAKNIPVFLEPFLLLIIGAVVAVLALGILLPIYQLGLYI